MAYLSQPPPFLQSARVTTVPLKQWISAFETYLLASREEAYSAERKRAMLLHCIGVNVVAERYRFRQRAQKTGETIDCHVASLRELSKTCDFGPMTDEMIQDQIIEKTATPRVRERLLMEKDLKLDGDIETAKCIENALKEAKAIGNSLTKETLEQDVYRLTSRGNKPNVTKTGTKSKRVCYRWGSTQHIASDPNCKARGKKCRNCKKIGHSAVMCRSKPITQTKNDVREVTTQNSTGPPSYHIPLKPGDRNYEVLANDSNGRKGSKSKRIRCVVMINGVPIQLDVDTGSDVSILSEEVFLKSFLSEALVKVQEGIELSSYTKHKIEVIGCFEATVSYLDRVDLAAAYHQLLLHPDSRPLTAFITHDGLFQYKRVCFGLSSAPSVFQKMMQSMLAGLSGVQCYLDDVIVYGKDEEEHNENLREVLTRLDSYGVKLNDKCKFNQSSIKFLGHIISSEGIRVDDKYNALANASVPKDPKSLRSFLGLAGYFSKYIPNFAQLVEPLRAILRKSNEFKWSTECQSSFDQLKSLISKDPVLAMYDPELEVVVRTDASQDG